MTWYKNQNTDWKLKPFNVKCRIWDQATMKKGDTTFSCNFNDQYLCSVHDRVAFQAWISQLLKFDRHCYETCQFSNMPVNTDYEHTMYLLKLCASYIHQSNDVCYFIDRPVVLCSIFFWYQILSGLFLGERVNKTFREIRSQSKVQVLDSKQNLSFKLVIQVSKSWLEIVLEFSVFTKGPFKYYVSMFLVF